MRLCTIKHYHKYYQDDLFEETLKQIDDYDKKNFTELDLEKYIEYGYVAEGDEIIAMCGITDFGFGCYRIESGCWINPKYRGNYFDPENKYNHYELSSHQMSKFEHKANVWFKSRIARNPAGIARLIPAGWKLYPEQIELCWGNNWQWVVYKGNIDEYLEKLQAPNINTYCTY